MSLLRKPTATRRYDRTAGALARPSADPGGDRRAEPCHPVEYVAPDFCLGPLIGQNPGVKAPADDALVAKHRGFNQTPAIMTRAALPAYASMLCNRREMFVALRRLSFHLERPLSVVECDRRVQVTLGNSIVDSLAIIRTICRHRRNVSIDLITGCGFLKAGKFACKRRRAWVFSRYHRTG
jgi:hypothetical protein